MISFTIGTFTDHTGKYSGIQQSQIATLLAAASTALSTALVGNATVSMDVTISSALGGAFASGGAKSSVPFFAKPGVNVLQNTVQDEIINGVSYAQSTAVLNLTEAFMTAISNAGNNLAGSFLNDVVEHELTHALGFNGYLNTNTGAAQNTSDGQGTVASLFDAKISMVGGKAYFTGASAMAIYGDKVPLVGAGSSSAFYHLDPTASGLASDILGPQVTSQKVVFGESAVDLAILHDLGYGLKQTLVSADGHSFLPGAGQQTLNGSVEAGKIDTAIFTGKRVDYAQATANGQITETTKASPADVVTFVGIERARFADTSVAFDTHGAQVYRLYEAAFHRIPDLQGIGFWLNAMDHGLSLNEVAAQFQPSAEFQSAYGGSNPTTAVLLDHLYHNVLNRAPDASGLDFWARLLTAPASSPDHRSVAEVVVYFSESPENVAQVIGQVSGGVQFTPFLG